MLAEIDIFAIAKAVTGRPWAYLPVSPFVGNLLSNIQPKDGPALLKMMGAEISAAVLKIDPDCEPPFVVPSIRSMSNEVSVPALPESARLSAAALESAVDACPFLDRFLTWAVQRSPMTPPFFLEAGVIWMIGVVIAGRLRLNVYRPLAPNLYILWIAKTSIHKKTTGMEAVADLLLANHRHLLFPSDTTPESLSAYMAGEQPSNYDKLPAYQKKHVDRGRLYAAQRALLVDEAQALLSNDKDYKKGLDDLLMNGFNANGLPFDASRSGSGYREIRDACLSILGATTPISFGRAVSMDAWESGKTARYALLYPDGIPLKYELPNLTPDEYKPPRELIHTLLTLDNSLPKPPDMAFMADEDHLARPRLWCEIAPEATEAMKLYNEALSFEMIKNDQLDPRIEGNYSRLPELAIKIAICIAGINWAENTDRPPRIELNHWARAQLIAESWRASLHRLLKSVDMGEDARTENAILEHLLKHREGETIREIVQRTGRNRKSVQEAIEALRVSGLVIEDQRKGTRGPAAVIYLPV
jgi:hypothetical protein